MSDINYKIFLFKLFLFKVTVIAKKFLSFVLYRLVSRIISSLGRFVVKMI